MAVEATPAAQKARAPARAAVRAVRCVRECARSTNHRARSAVVQAVRFLKATALAVDGLLRDQVGWVAAAARCRAQSSIVRL